MLTYDLGNKSFKWENKLCLDFDKLTCNLDTSTFKYRSCIMTDTG